MKKIGTTVAAVAISGVLLVGCDPGPKCLRGHIQTSVSTAIVNGKPSMVTTSTYICDEYEESK